ncbi:endothelin-2 precursor [Prionailurus iriomotensis]
MVAMPTAWCSIALALLLALHEGQGPGGCCSGPTSTLTPRPSLPPAASTLLLQLLARQGMCLLLPPGHHLGEHSRHYLAGCPPTDRQLLTAWEIRQDAGAAPCQSAVSAPVAGTPPVPPSAIEGPRPEAMVVPGSGPPPDVFQAGRARPSAGELLQQLRL